MRSSWLVFRRANRTSSRSHHDSDLKLSVLLPTSSAMRVSVYCMSAWVTRGRFMCVCLVENSKELPLTSGWLWRIFFLLGLDLISRSTKNLKFLLGLAWQGTYHVWGICMRERIKQKKHIGSSKLGTYMSAWRVDQRRLYTYQQNHFLLINSTLQRVLAWNHRYSVMLPDLMAILRRVVEKKCYLSMYVWFVWISCDSCSSQQRKMITLDTWQQLRAFLQRSRPITNLKVSHLEFVPAGQKG